MFFWAVIAGGAGVALGLAIKSGDPIGIVVGLCLIILCLIGVWEL